MSKSKKMLLSLQKYLKTLELMQQEFYDIGLPPDRELEWTDNGIQSSKNLINRIDRYFEKEKTTTQITQ